MIVLICPCWQRGHGIEVIFLARAVFHNVPGREVRAEGNGCVAGSIIGSKAVETLCCCQYGVHEPSACAVTYRAPELGMELPSW